MMWGAGVGVCVVWHIQHEQSVRVTWMHHLDTQGTAGEQARLSRTIERSDRKRGEKKGEGEKQRVGHRRMNTVIIKGSG